MLQNHGSGLDKAWIAASHTSASLILPTREEHGVEEDFSPGREKVCTISYIINKAQHL